MKLEATIEATRDEITTIDLRALNRSVGLMAVANLFACVGPVALVIFLETSLGLRIVHTLLAIMMGVQAFANARRYFLLRVDVLQHTKAMSPQLVEFEWNAVVRRGDGFYSKRAWSSIDKASVVRAGGGKVLILTSRGDDYFLPIPARCFGSSEEFDRWVRAVRDGIKNERRGRGFEVVSASDQAPR